jgi:hypothetical protein
MRIRFAHFLFDTVELRTQPGQRCAQIMCDVVAYPFYFAHQPFDLVEHVIDDRGEPVQLVTAFAYGQTPM